MVRFAGMLSLLAAVSVHSVRIYHQIELTAGLLKGVHQLEGVLEVNVVVTRAVGQFKMHAVRQISGVGKHPGPFEPVGIQFRGEHEALGIM